MIGASATAVRPLFGCAHLTPLLLLRTTTCRTRPAPARRPPGQSVRCPRMLLTPRCPLAGSPLPAAICDRIAGWAAGQCPAVGDLHHRPDRRAARRKRRARPRQEDRTRAAARARAALEPAARCRPDAGRARQSAGRKSAGSCCSVAVGDGGCSGGGRLQGARRRALAGSRPAAGSRVALPPYPPVVCTGANAYGARLMCFPPLPPPRSNAPHVHPALSALACRRVEAVESRTHTPSREGEVEVRSRLPAGGGGWCLGEGGAHPRTPSCRPLPAGEGVGDAVPSSLARSLARTHALAGAGARPHAPARRRAVRHADGHSQTDSD